MSSQSTLLHELLAQFKLDDSEPGFSLPASSAAAQPLHALPEEGGFNQGGNGGFGKY